MRLIYRKRKRRRNIKTGRTLTRQVLLCILLLLIIIAAKKMDTAIVQTTYNLVKSQFAKNITLEDAGRGTASVFSKLKSGTITVVASLAGGDKALKFTLPSDEPGTYSVSSSGSMNGKTLEFYSDKEIQVYAAAGGTISEIGEDAGGNKYIKIYHGNEITSLYGGCTNTYVKPLEKVKRGQIIGSVGSGGDNILKFEIWDRGKLKDPTDYIKPGN